MDLETGTFSVPVRRTLRLQEVVDIALNSKYTTARKVASISGTLISMGLSLVQWQGFGLGPFTITINSRQSWNREMILLNHGTN